MTAYINHIGTAVPDHDVHHQFAAWAINQLEAESDRKLFSRMVGRSDIDHRWSILPASPNGGSPVEPGGFYAGDLPSTAVRMAHYADYAPELALTAIRATVDPVQLPDITHLIVASCTGFVAPGVDQIIARRLGLSDRVERLLVGFMGCYAAISALRSARHIVRSDPQARILVVCVELSSLHLQEATTLEPLLAMLQFGDGAAAALVTGEPHGLAIHETFSVTLPGTEDLIRWTIGDTGFAMHLSGAVPHAITAMLQDQAVRAIFETPERGAINSWAVHAGGRSILDAVAHGLALSPIALEDSRAVLRNYGNMSSATLMFVLARKLAQRAPQNGVAMAFGPGLAAEGFRYEAV